MLYDTKWDAAKKIPPKFGRRWHSFSRLDIRPVLWSLRNRPDEWEVSDSGCRLIHKPSQHTFWIGNGLFFYGLHDANCSCTQASGGSFSFIQKIQFSFARRTITAIARARANEQLAKINEQFTEHFTS